MSNRGHDRERQLKTLLEAYDWLVLRAAGSLGGIDLVAMHANWQRPLLIEVKATASGPFAGFGPKDRALLMAAAVKGNARCTLAWWPYDRQGLRWFPPMTWPGLPKGDSHEESEIRVTHAVAGLLVDTLPVKLPAPAVKKLAVLAPVNHMGPLPAAPPGVIGTIQGAIKPDQRGMIRPRLRRL